MTEVAFNNSVVLAQGLLAAITIAYGSAFFGLWLAYRREAMAGFAVAWVGLGLFSALSILAQLPPGGQRYIAGWVAAALPYLVVIVGTFAALAFVHASYSVVAPGTLRRQLVWIGVLISAVLVAGVAVGVSHEFSTRPVVLGALGSALWVAIRAPSSPGRRSMIIALSLLILRPAFSLLDRGWDPGTQPVWYTILQLAVTMAAGFLTTVAVYSLERDAAVRERAALEKSLAQSQRMDSMGRMASSVAHDFNNILTSVLSASEFVDEASATPRERGEAAADIRTAVERGTALTRQLLAFARPDSASTEFDPAHRIAELMPIVERLAGRDVRVTCAVAEPLTSKPVRVNADPVQFDQLVLNLTANARDAMPLGGPLTIRCDLKQAPRIPGMSRALDGPHLRLEIADRGTGMTKEIAEHIFEPFFTTKGAGKGTGLGLSTAFGFVRQARGEILVESVIGQGTTFTIFLPVAAA